MYFTFWSSTMDTTGYLVAFLPINWWTGWDLRHSVYRRVSNQESFLHFSCCSCSSQSLYFLQMYLPNQLFSDLWVNIALDFICTIGSFWITALNYSWPVISSIFYCLTLWHTFGVLFSFILFSSIDSINIFRFFFA